MCVRDVLALNPGRTRMSLTTMAKRITQKVDAAGGSQS